MFAIRRSEASAVRNAGRKKGSATTVLSLTAGDRITEGLSYQPEVGSHKMLRLSLAIFFATRKSGSGTSVWTGRALQAESDDLEVTGLALLYPAL